MLKRASAFAPGTVANLGAGFDVLGLAIKGPGDTVSVEITGGAQAVFIDEIRGDDGRLPLEAQRNAAGIAALATLKRAGVTAQVRLRLEKGLGIGTGLGSSAASAAAAAYAVNLALGKPLRKIQLVEPCIEAEAYVSGRHADNVAPALLGGLVLVKSLEPLEVLRLPVPEGLFLTLVTPHVEVETRAAREVVPSQVALRDAVAQGADLGSFVAACYSGDYTLLGRSLTDRYAAPYRLGLVPGASEAIEAAIGVGALGASLSGSGPTVFALNHSRPSAERCRNAMLSAFTEKGVNAGSFISSMDCPGVRAV